MAPTTAGGPKERRRNDPKPCRSANQQPPDVGRCVLEQDQHWTDTPQPASPLEIRCDMARVVALTDVRHLLGTNKTAQIRLTFILMDHDLTGDSMDYLVPSPDSPVWGGLPNVSDKDVATIRQRISRIPHERLSYDVRWNANKTEIQVGHHRIRVLRRDVQTLRERWCGPSAGIESLEIARLLALYHVFDEPYSAHRNGVHLGLDPGIRKRCDFELFASPLNAVVGNGRYASKWPHIEWRFGSMGSFPSVIDYVPTDAVVVVNPPYTDGYMESLIPALPALKQRFRLRLAIPLGYLPACRLRWLLPGVRQHYEFYDASGERSTVVKHNALFWEDPRLASLDELSGSEAEPLPMSMPLSHGGLTGNHNEPIFRDARVGDVCLGDDRLGDDPVNSVTATMAPLLAVPMPGPVFMPALPLCLPCPPPPPQLAAPVVLDATSLQFQHFAPTQLPGFPAPPFDAEVMALVH